MSKSDMFYPPIAKFAVLCRPSGWTMYVAAASFAGAVRTAKENQFSEKKDREFYPRFLMWQRRAGEPERSGKPPQEFEWPEVSEGSPA